MAYRWLGSLSVVLALAVSCGSDDDKKVVTAEDAGAGGEPGVSGNTGSGGSEARPDAGAPSQAGAAGSSSAGGEPTNGGQPASGGQPSVGGEPGAEAGAGGARSAGGAAGAGGTPNDDPVSACGEGSYQDAAAECQTCTPKPDPNYPTALGCNNFSFANFNSYDGWLDLGFETTIYEAFSGELDLAWANEDESTGQVQTDWSYQGVQGESHVFRISLGDEAENAAQFSINYWAFGDACQYNYYAASITLVYDGEGWHITNCG